MKKQMIAAFLIFALLLGGCAQSAVTPSDPTDDILLENPTTGPAEPSESAVPTDGSEPTDGTEPADETTAPTAPATEAPATEAPTEAPATEAPKATTPHTHSYTSTVVAPTCTSQGYTLHTCTCGSSYKDSYTAALGHDYQITYEGTSAQAHTVQYTCSRCGDYYATDTALTDAELEEFRYEVSRAAVKYINEYRVAEGSTELTWLPGLSEVAMYRSEQLITNYAHDTADMRAACAYFKYGRYVDATQYGDDASLSYYTHDGNEAIGYGYGYGSSADAIGKDIADGVYASKSHWRYIGDSMYSYASVGWCKEGYVAVLVTPINYG